MRIIGGLYRGKKLLSPSTTDIRPTADKARESVFNILFSKLDKQWQEITVADIFCGTGAFGLEAVSRGVKQVALVDININAAAKIVALFPQEKNKINLIKANAINLPFSAKQYDVIFMDAPYQQNLSEKALASVIEKRWLSPNGICIVETAHDEELPIPENMEVIDIRKYGIAKFHFITFK